MPLRVAMFPRGLDGMYLTAPDGVQVLALVRTGSPEEAWATSFLGPSCLLPYRMPKGDLGSYPSTEDLLCRSDIHRVMKRAGVQALLLSSSCSPAMEAWARRHGICLLMSDYEHQRRLEDKGWFTRFMKRHGIPSPAGKMVVLGPTRTLPVPGRAVVQAPESMGGEGTYFVQGPAEVEELLRKGVLRRGEPYLVRQFIEGLPYGITAFVAPGCISLSGIRLQCYYPAEGKGTSRVFAGIQWVPQSSLPVPVRHRVSRTFLEVGRLLYRRRFLGFANLDFMLDRRGQVFVLECNPRMSAATPQLLRYPELMSGVPAGALFLRGFLGRRTYPRSPSATPLPDTAYQGATLDIVYQPPSPGRVQREFRSGLYALRAGRISYVSPDVRRFSAAGHFCLFSFACAGQHCQPGDTLASIITNFALYDDCGDMLAPARKLVSFFRYI